MTDAPSSYDEIFPALDGLSNTSTTTNINSITSTISNNQTSTTTNTNLLANNVTSSWSAHNQALNQTTIGQQSQQQQPSKLEYIQHIQQIQHLYQQQQQQVLNNLVESNTDTKPKTTSSALVTPYHNDLQPKDQQQPKQPPQQQQQQKQPQPQPQPQSQFANNINLSNSNTMQATSNAANQRRPGLPNPIASERFCTFKIAPEERRHRNFDSEQSSILKEIMQKTHTKIEVTTTKDGALNFCIIGKELNLPNAKNLVLNDFQTQVTLTVSVPKSIHGRLLGPKGARLAGIQDETQTKITIPRKEEDSDIIKIVGLKSNAEMAVRSIEKCARDYAGKAVEKVTVERIYLLFITGAFNENLKRWEESGARVSTSGGILPSNSDRESGHADEVTFTIAGEISAVNQVKEEIIHIYEDKKKKCTTVNIEVKKAQHKYILGPNGQNLRNLFAKTGVSVELPQESESETITLRGERSKIATALSELYTQAHSETDEFFEVETWLHKYLVGPRKTNFIDFKALGVDVKSLDDKIKLHGPPTEVENIIDIFENELKTIRTSIIRKDIRVEPRIHGYIIGRAGATVDKIRDESNAHVVVPKNDEPSEFITLEGTREAVAIAEEKINAIAKKYEASRKLVIDQQLHGSIIGRGGEKIRSIREKFSQIVFNFPDQGSKHNEITIVGPAEEVEECYKYLDEFHMQLQENNHQVQVPIRNDIIKYLSDAQATIKRIRVDHRVKIDLFVNNTEIGKENISASKQQTDGNSDHNEPANENNSEGKKKSGKQAKAAKQAAGAPGQATITKQPNGVSQNNKSATEKRDENYAVVTGKKEDVDQAKTKLSKLFDELSTTTEFEVKVPQKLRTHLGPKSKLYKQFLEEFQMKIVVSFPPASRQQQEGKQQVKQSATGDEATGAAAVPETNGVATSATGKKNKATKEDGNNNNNSNSNNNNNKDRIEVVKIRGPKNIAKKAEKRFEALIIECQDKVDKNHTAYVLVETAIIDKFLYADKVKLNKIRESQNVKLNIPDRRENPTIQCCITGYEKSVQDALQQFNTLVKDVEERAEETIEIASQVHPRLIGAQGRAVKKLMEDFKVGVKFARQGDPNPDSVTLFGRLDCISAAKKQMMKLADQFLASAGRANNNNNNEANNNHSSPGGNQAASNISNNSNSNNSHQQAQHDGTPQTVVSAVKAE